MSYNVKVTKNPLVSDGDKQGYTAALCDGEQPLCAASGKSRANALMLLHGVMSKMHEAHHSTVVAALENLKLYSSEPTVVEIARIVSEIPCVDLRK